MGSEVITVDIVEAGAPNIDEVLLVLLYIMQCGFSGYQIFRLWISPHCTNYIEFIAGIILYMFSCGRVLSNKHLS